MRYIDTHAHYTDKAFNPNREEIIQKMRQANVEKIINIGCGFKEAEETITFTKQYDFIYGAIGIHPENIQEYDFSRLTALYEQHKSEKIVAIGEIGLDYAYIKDNRQRQIEVFREQMQFAQEVKLPIIVHSRDAALDTYEAVKETVKPGHKLLFHCFAPTDDLVRLVLDKGYYVAFGGNITYPRNVSFKQYIEKIPIEQMVIETDAPYLAPIPVRGSINDASNLPIICRKLAEMKEVEEEQLAETLYQNSIRFFDLT